MLPKTKRLNLSKSFQWVSQGKIINDQFFQLRVRFGENEQALIGIALSSKNFKKAHNRNQAKRLVSSLIEEFYPTLPKGLNLVIMPKGEILEANKEKVRVSLKDCLEKTTIHV
jgi:ribonuclease P protein component